MIMKYITEDILNFYQVNYFLCAYFAEKMLKIIVLACYIAFILQYFGLISVVNPIFRVKYICLICL